MLLGAPNMSLSAKNCPRFAPEIVHGAKFLIITHRAPPAIMASPNNNNIFRP